MASNAKTAPAPLDFNHAMIYSRDLSRALEFYRDLLGLTLLEEFRMGDRIVYARLRLGAGTSTIALHLLGPGDALNTGGVRLYFEVRSLDGFCKKLEAAGAKFTKPPTVMPWGWKHAYLDDPDGHEISLYWAGAKRLKKVNSAGSKP
jgi:catechol 2,3-dioxygenase-like lactoylglutathione lyase family enzyme